MMYKKDSWGAPCKALAINLTLFLGATLFWCLPSYFSEPFVLFLFVFRVCFFWCMHAFHATFQSPLRYFVFFYNLFLFLPCYFLESLVLIFHRFQAILFNAFPCYFRSFSVCLINILFCLNMILAHTT